LKLKIKSQGWSLILLIYFFSGRCAMQSYARYCKWSPRDCPKDI